MIDNPILDVTIGLVFIFVLYSLLATTINELIATIFSYRSRMLELALERMFDGKNYSYYWWDKLANIFLFLWYWFIFFLRKLNSTINNLKPTAQNIKPIRENTKPYGIKQFLKPGPLPQKHFRRRRLNKKADLFTAKFTAHPLYRRAAENSLLYKKPAYLTATTFSDILLDIISPPSNKPSLLSDIERYISELPNTGSGGLSIETKKIIKIYINQANGDLQRFKLLIEDWYNDTMNRVSGWYKKQSYIILLFTGVVLASIFNVDTIAIVGKLSNDKVSREAMIKSVSKYVEQQSNSKDNQTPTAEIDIEKIKEGVDKINYLYENSIKEQNTTLGIGWTAKKQEAFEIWKNNYMIRKKFYNFRIYFFFNDILLALPGFLITALAISFGAPFWFDLLNKLVSLRVSGKRPEDDKSTNSKTANLNQKPQPNSFG